MSLYGTMRTGVSGMNAQANRLSTTGENIANSSTVGYKKADVQFSSMILPSTGGAYNPGGVETQVRYSISEQGSFSYTTSKTDLAIKGNGFFIVTGADGTEFLTRAGSFVVQADGTLQNTAGFTLMGYEYDSTTDPTIVINGFEGLTEINVRAGGLQATPSTAGSVQGNLPGNAEVGFSKTSSIVAYDSQGNSRLLDLVYTKSGVNTWTLDVQYQGTSITGQTALGSTTATVSGSLSNTAATGDIYTTNVLAYGSDGSSHNLTYEYTKSATGWDLRILDGNTQILASTPMTFDPVTGALVTPAAPSTVNTTANGTLGALAVNLSALTEATGASNALANTNGNGAGYELEFDALGQLVGPANVTSIAQTINGATLNGLTIDVTGVSQLGDDYSAEGDINGQGASEVDRVDISADGIVSIIYKNGQSIPTYRIAMANVQSPDNLTPLAGNVYSQSNSSGVIVMGYPGNASLGTIISGALENSNVDIAEELTGMIEAQRNYTANSKVFQTGSELLEVLVNLKR